MGWIHKWNKNYRILHLLWHQFLPSFIFPLSSVVIRKAGLGQCLLASSELYLTLQPKSFNAVNLFLHCKKCYFIFSVEASKCEMAFHHSFSNTSSHKYAFCLLMQCSLADANYKICISIGIFLILNLAKILTTITTIIDWRCFSLWVSCIFSKIKR